MSPDARIRLSRLARAHIERREQRRAYRALARLFLTSVLLALIGVGLVWAAEGWRGERGRGAGVSASASAPQAARPLPAPTTSAPSPQGAPTDQLVRGARVRGASLESLRALLPAARAEVEARLGARVPAVRLSLHAHAEDMRAAATAEQGWAPPEWANGLAYPQAGAVYLHEAPPAELRRTLTHELAHIAVGDLSAQGGRPVPLWLNEGLAVVASERVSWERMWDLSGAAAVGGLLSFEALTRSFPTSGGRAEVAYAQSAHFVTYLSDTRGRPAVLSFTRALASGAPLAAAARAHLGADLATLEAEWRATLSGGALGWALALTRDDTLLGVGALALTLAGLLALRRRARGRAPSSPEAGLRGVRVLREDQ
jgi:hypothetical protein